MLCEAIALAQELAHGPGEIQATLWLATDRIWQGVDAFEPLASRGRALARSIGDRSGEALASLLLGRAAFERRRFDEAATLFLESARVYEEAGCVLGVPLAIQFAGLCALERLAFRTARRFLDDALVRHRRVGNVHDAAATLRALATLELNEHRFDDARVHCAESLRMFRSLHDSNCAAGAAEIRARILAATGEVTAALEDAEYAAATYRGLGFSDALARALWAIGRLHWTSGNTSAARRDLSDALLELKRAKRQAPMPGLFEAIAALHADDPLAPQLLGFASAVRERSRIPVFPAERVEHTAWQAAVRDRHADAEFAAGVSIGRTLAYDVSVESALRLSSRLNAGAPASDM